jgi:hypothetical protein
MSWGQNNVSENSLATFRVLRASFCQSLKSLPKVKTLKLGLSTSKHQLPVMLLGYHLHNTYVRWAGVRSIINSTFSEYFDILCRTWIKQFRYFSTIYIL